MRRWINTLVLFDARGRVVKREGYWYDGPVALASVMFAIDQDSYAFYDDGTESGSSQVGSTNTQTTLDVDTNYQCRLLFQETNAMAGTFKSINWEYNHNSGGWTSVTTSSSVIIAVDSANLTHDADTTQRIGSGTYDSTNAMVTEDGSSTNNDMAASSEVEGLLSFQVVGADVSDGDEILLRVAGADTWTRDADIDVNKAAATRRVMVVT